MTSFQTSSLVLSSGFKTTEGTEGVFFFFFARIKPTQMCLKLHCSELIVKTTTYEGHELSAQGLLVCDCI